MAPPLLSDLTPELTKLMTELIAMAPAGASLQSSAPPDYFDPGYVPRVNHGNDILGVIITFTIIAFITVCLRIYARATQKNRALGLDDFTIIPGMVSLTVS